MNSYVFHPVVDLDYAELNAIVTRQRGKFINRTYRHHRLVSDEPYLIELQQRYPLLSGVYNLYDMPVELVPHVDSDRLASFNIPLGNTETTVTTFYDYVGHEGEYFDGHILNRFDITQLSPVYKFKLVEPTIINTKKIHGVTFEDGHRGNRVTISWSFLPEVTYAQACQAFSEGVVGGQ